MIFIAVFERKKRYLYVMYHPQNETDIFYIYIVGLLTRFITLIGD